MLRLDLVGYLSFCLFSSVAGYEYISSISREANAMIEKLETNEMPVDGTTGYWKLHRFSAGDPTTNRARCLDGSYAGFWFEGGSGDGVDKFVVHHMGGGCIHSLTYPLTYLPNHSLIYSLTHLPTHSLTYSLTYSLTHSLFTYIHTYIHTC